MKSWLDLSEKEKTKLLNDFKKKKSKPINIRYALYICSFISFLLLVTDIILSEEMVISKVKFVVLICLFIIFFLLAIINGLFISRWEDEFDKWLETKDIVR